MATRVNGSTTSPRIDPTPIGSIPPFQQEYHVSPIPHDDQPHDRVNPIGQISRGGIGHSTSFAALTPSSVTAYEKQYYPSQPISLSGIASRAFMLGIGLAFSATLAVHLALQGSLFWRPLFFAATLSSFHFLEFWTTARYNTRAAQVSSFLLNQNGSAYTIAHAAAMAESLLSCFLSTYFPFPNRFSTFFFPSWTASPLPTWLTPLTPAAGLALVVVGQAVRSLAMAQAAESFNHIVQARKASSHRLVTSGIYAVFRHPSYWGFFWWGLGTQLVLGNIVCFVGYAAVLWIFFKRRIAGAYYPLFSYDDGADEE